MTSPKSALRKQGAWHLAIGEPTRLALIRALAAGEKTVTKLSDEINTEMMNVSHYLKILRAANVVSGEKSGQYVIYSLVNGAVETGMLALTHPSGTKVILPLE